MIAGLLALALAACSYAPEFKDCAVQCAAGVCPDGLHCGNEGLCRTRATAQTCLSVLGDAGLTADANPDARVIDASVDAPDALSLVTLSQTPPDVATQQGPGCWDVPSGNIYDDQWYRVFPLTGPFVATDVSFWVWRVSTVWSASITVGSYAGTFPSSSFQSSQFTHLGTASAQVYGPGLVSVHLPQAVLVTGKLAIEINTGAGFLLGAVAVDTPAQDHGYVSSTSCSMPTPTSDPAGFIITVSGSYQ